MGAGRTGSSGLAGLIAVAAISALMLGATAGPDAPAAASERQLAGDPAAGELAGLRLGQSGQEVVKTLGRGDGRPGRSVFPTGQDLETTTAPGTFRAPGKPSPDVEPRFLRYPTTSVGLVGGRVFVVMSTADGARISAHAAIGDPLGSVSERYRRLTCHVATDAHGRDTFPYCTGRLAPHRYLYVGGDPVTSAAVATVPLNA